ncbi:HlyD family type I secretion periplasmic adaptor subunit [Amylibacter sp.]|nr:HlyD family type I secretion periplasmic adaptor subunit [Amylibacter sp.]
MSEIDFKKLSRQMAGREKLSGSLILLTILLLVITAVYWANHAELDNVTRGDGRIISSAQNQMIQASEGGVILRRYVTENTIVSEGEILFELDPIDASSELNSLLQRLSALDIKESRLRSEITGKDFILSPDIEDGSSIVALTELSLFAARKTELNGELAVLEQRSEQKSQELEAAQATLEASIRTMELLEEEIAIVAPLVKDNIAPKTRLLELQRNFEKSRGDLNRAKVSINQARSGARELDFEIQNARDNYILQAMDELNSVVAKQTELMEALPRLKERVSRTTIRAPMGGVVNRINFRTTGGYVNTGDIILELVPTGEALVVEAKISTKDISNIFIDDEVKIRLSAYDSAKYGSVKGRVIRISPDAITDDNGVAESYYLIDVAIEGELFIEDEGIAVTFIPGMTATVDVLSGKRTVFEYIWQPVTKVKELALRD